LKMNREEAVGPVPLCRKRITELYFTRIIGTPK